MLGVAVVFLAALSAARASYRTAADKPSGMPCTSSRAASLAGERRLEFAVASRGTIEDPDKEWLEVDRHPQSPFRGNVYVTYTDFSDLATPDVGAVIRFRKWVGRRRHVPARS